MRPSSLVSGPCADRGRATATPFCGWSGWRARAPHSSAGPRGTLVGPPPARLERVLTRSLDPSSIPSLGDGVMLGTAWIDRPVATRGRAPCFHVLLSAAWKRGHAQANDRHSPRVFAMPPERLCTDDPKRLTRSPRRSAVGETRKLAAILVSDVVGAREGPARGQRAPS